MPAFYHIFLLLPVAVAAVSVADHRSQRTKRSLLDLAEAIKCGTGTSPFWYLTYGCYCGNGGHGLPKDEVDWCCFRHDDCYGKIEEHCETKTKHYRLTCEDATAECDDLEDKCNKQVCKCDSDLAKCLKKAPYNLFYCLWPDFLCRGD